MPITDLTDDELDRFEVNYRRANKTAGGKYSLSEILLEKSRRSPCPFGVRETAAKIVELAASSRDGLVTYGEIWAAFRPDEPWTGHKTLRVVADSLFRVIHFCVTNRLPILTSVVVRGTTRKLSDQAIGHIYNECKELGIDVGLDPKVFVDDQAKLTRTVVARLLPKAD